MKTILLSLFFILVSNLSFASGGGFEDGLADTISWIVILVFPLIGIYLFWKAHIYPEIVAEKNNHPQLEAIKTMCLLSLFVGGLLWPIALIWANYKYPEQKLAEQIDQESLEGEKAVVDEVQKTDNQINSDEDNAEKINV